MAVSGITTEPSQPPTRVRVPTLGMGGGSAAPDSFSKAFKKLGRPLPDWGKLTTPNKPAAQRRRDVKYTTPRNPNYQKIKVEVLQRIALLPPEQQATIPSSGTLPEQMVGLALAWLNLPAEAQISENGGRKRLGGSVVDWKVGFGTQIVIIRVQGDYWHASGDRKLVDLVQYDRLHRMKYLVTDIWETELYEAWTENRLRQLVEAKLFTAA